MPPAPVHQLLALCVALSCGAACSSAASPGQLPFPLRELLPGMIEAHGGQRRWAGLRDIAIVQTRKQLKPDGTVRASETIRLFIQNVPHVNLLLMRQTGSNTIQQGWSREQHWMVENGLRIRDRARLDAARTELLESLLLDRLPFCLTELVHGAIVLEGEFERAGRTVYRLRVATREFPAGPVWLLSDTRTLRLAAIGYEDPEGRHTEVGFRIPQEERGLRIPWFRDFTVDGALVRQDEIREIRTNQWFSPRVFQPASWLK